jgi:hypothetical protein
MVRHSVLMIICAGLALPSLTACQADRSAYSLRDDSAARDQAQEREIQRRLATSMTR